MGSSRCGLDILVRPWDTRELNTPNGAHIILDRRTPRLRHSAGVEMSIPALRRTMLGWPSPAIAGVSVLDFPVGFSCERLRGDRKSHMRLRGGFGQELGW